MMLVAGLQLEIRGSLQQAIGGLRQTQTYE